MGYKTLKKLSIFTIALIFIGTNIIPTTTCIFNNNIKLNTPQPAVFPPYNERISCGFGVISNPKRVAGDCSYYWSFNCENVICRT